jgi:hypothetical protein
MYTCYKNNILETPTLYINYRKIKDLEKKERKNIFKKEIVYLFFKENILRDFYKNKYHRKINEGENFMFGLKN